MWAVGDTASNRGPHVTQVTRERDISPSVGAPKGYYSQAVIALKVTTP